MASVERVGVFCYGSNGIEQMRQRCENPRLKAQRAHLPGYARIFAGFSPIWGGAVASIVPMVGCTVFGSVVMLSREELELLDQFEGVDSSDPFSLHGVYRRQPLDVVADGADCAFNSIAYVKNNLEWRDGPSESYLLAVKRNIEQFWAEDGGVTITVRKGDGSFVQEWSPLLEVASKAEHAMPAPAAIFSYGTLRADLSADGDRWGVCQIGGGCSWSHGQVQGFRLYQERGLFYPFAAEASSDTDSGAVVKGTILSWPSNVQAFKEALERCDAIEGYEPGGNGLYKRSAVEVQVQNQPSGAPHKVLAYMYHQDLRGKDLSSCTSFPDGCWLKAGRD